MRIRTRLILSFLAMSVLPMAVAGYVGLWAMERVGSLAMGESTEALRRSGEATIHQKALDVARQVELYLEARPELSPYPSEELGRDEELAAIAVQPVGETGYTAVYDSSAVVLFHPNPDMVGTDLHELAGTLPAFWAIFEASLDGTEVAGYYEWQDADGVVREKYMSCVPVGDTPLRVAATTYIDEFYQPIRDTEAEITSISDTVRRYLFIALGIAGLFSIGLALWLAWGISRPIQALIQASAALEEGVYRSEGLAVEVSRRDDLGQLARVFDRMAKEVQAREAFLRHQIQGLRIEVDEAKRKRQVAQITETEYFRQLQQKARRMRRALSSSSSPAQEGQGEQGRA